MKVMLPVKDNQMRKNEIADGFHNIEFVCIYDSNLKTTEWFSAKEISETEGGLNSGLIQRGIYCIISKNVTPMVLTMFKRNGIDIYKAQGFDVLKNIEMFQEKQLTFFTTEELRQNTSCSSGLCSSCSSTCN